MDAMPTLFTRTDYDRLPEGYPAQLIEGQLVREPSPSFGHQRLALDIAVAFRDLVGHRRVVTAPADVPIDDWNVFQPDVVVLRADLPDDARDVGIPLVAVEVLSPSTASRDRRIKTLRMIDAGVAEVWLVDPHSSTIERYDRERYRDVPQRAAGAQVLRSDAVAGFALTALDLFGK